MNSRLMMKTSAFVRVSVLLLKSQLNLHLEAVDRRDHDDRYQRKRPLVGCDNHDKVHEL